MREKSACVKYFSVLPQNFRWAKTAVGLLLKTINLFFAFLNVSRNRSALRKSRFRLVSEFLTECLENQLILFMTGRGMFQKMELAGNGGR